MEKNKNIHEEVEKTLNALKNVSVPETNPFLYTRLMSNIQSETERYAQSKLKISPAYSLIMALLILLNVFSFVYFTGKDSTESSGRQEFLTELANEYSINYQSEF